MIYEHWKQKIIKKYLTHYLLVFLLVMVGIFFVSYQLAAQTTSLTASITISVCGNDVKESGEQCDGSDFANRSCTTLGFSGGIIACDSACSFNVSSCSSS